jgi:hypothetical protein
MQICTVTGFSIFLYLGESDQVICRNIQCNSYFPVRCLFGFINLCVVNMCRVLSLDSLEEAPFGECSCSGRR